MRFVYRLETINLYRFPMFILAGRNEQLLPRKNLLYKFLNFIVTCVSDVSQISSLIRIVRKAK